MSLQFKGNLTSSWRWATGIHVDPHLGADRTIQTKSGASADHGWPSMHASGLGSSSGDCINLMTSVSKLQMAWCILVYLLGFSRVCLSLAKTVGHAVHPFPLKLMTPPPTRR